MDTLSYITNKFGLNLKQKSPIVVPGLSRISLASLFAELGFRRGVEIGVQTGKYSKVLCDANPEMEFYGIDPWEEYPDYSPHDDEEGYKIGQEGEDRGYAEALARVPTAKFIRKRSMDAIDMFEDSYFDFVYIDGNHRFIYATNDMRWIEKVRVGGIISGHDYRRYYPRSNIHVYQLINAWTDAYGIHPWFVTDYETEKVRSWFWVKS
jgi:hypothetical protein